MLKVLDGVVGLGEDGLTSHGGGRLSRLVGGGWAGAPGGHPLRGGLFLQKTESDKESGRAASALSMREANYGSLAQSLSLVSLLSCPASWLSCLL